MGHGNLPDGGHDKVTWKRRRDLLTRHCSNVTPSRCRDVPQWQYWVFHFGVAGDVVGTYQWDVVDTYHWDFLVTYHWDIVGCFIWDLFQMLRRSTDETSLLRSVETSSWCSNKKSWRPTTETPLQRFTKKFLVVSFDMYLQRCWDVQRDVLTTSLRGLVTGCVCCVASWNLPLTGARKYSYSETSHQKVHRKCSLKELNDCGL